MQRSWHHLAQELQQQHGGRLVAYTGGKYEKAVWCMGAYILWFWTEYAWKLSICKFTSMKHRHTRAQLIRMHLEIIKIWNHKKKQSWLIVVNMYDNEIVILTLIILIFMLTKIPYELHPQYQIHFYSEKLDCCQNWLLSLTKTHKTSSLIMLCRDITNWECYLL